MNLEEQHQNTKSTSQMRQTSNKRTSFNQSVVSDEEEEEMPASTQMDMFLADEDEDEDEEMLSAAESEYIDDDVDLLTQARAQLEDKYAKKSVKTKKGKVFENLIYVEEDIAFNPKPNEREVTKLRQVYGNLNSEINRTSLRASTLS